MPAPLRSLPPTKKRKLDPSSSSKSDPKANDVRPQIKHLEDGLLASLNPAGEAGKGKASLNSLADLVNLVVELEDAQDVSKGVYALYRCFVVLISSGKLSGGAGDAAAKTVKAWLWERLHSYSDFLVGLLKDEEKHLRASALKILFSLLKHLSSAASEKSTPQFHVSFFKKIVHGLLVCPPSPRRGNTAPGSGNGIIEPAILQVFYDTWFGVNDDIRWFFLRESATLLNTTPKKSTSSKTAKNILFILEKLSTFPTEKAELNSWWIPELGAKPPTPKKLRTEDDVDEDALSNPSPNAGEEEQGEEDDWRKFFEDEPAPEPTKSNQATVGRLHQLTVHQSLHSLASHKAVFTRAWLALLPRLSVHGASANGAEEGYVVKEKIALAVRVLNIMHRGVLPHLTRPILVMDWIAGCVDLGGSVGLLALNGLFSLMKDYNLDYPSFYTRLYAFLDRDVLHSKHRARFFRMTDLFLSSTHLPATLLASFVKRLTRLSLNAPPAAIVMIIPFTYNVLKKHPALMVMIHRDEVEGVFEDPFDSLETNPLSTNALESSLWELLSHQTHYHATVSTLCKIFGEAFTKPNYAMEDFLDHTYATLIETEVNRKIKKEPPLAMEGGAKFELFPVVPLKRGVEGEEAKPVGDVVNELWVL